MFSLVVQSTTTQENFPRVTDEAFIRQMLEAGTRVFTFVEYVPMEQGTTHLVLTPEQKKVLQIVLADFNRKFPALFIGFPGDEDVYGGCLARWPGFRACQPVRGSRTLPRSSVLRREPYDHASQRSAQVPICLPRIRKDHGLLTESTGGCALRANRTWVQQILSR